MNNGRTFRFLAYTVFAVASVGAVYSFNSFLFSSLVTVKAIEGLEPLNVENTWRFIEPQLAVNGKVAFVHELVANQYEESKRLHDLLLVQAVAQRNFARNQSVIWSALLLVSFGTLVRVLRSRNNAL